MDGATIESSCITLAKDDYGYGNTSSNNEENSSCNKEDNSSGGKEDNTDNKVPKAESGLKTNAGSNDYSIDSCAGADDEDNNTNVNPVEALLQLQSIRKDLTSYYRERRLRNLEAKEFENEGFIRPQRPRRRLYQDGFSKFLGGT